jgi:hypothetical protein
MNGIDGRLTQELIFGCIALCNERVFVFEAGDRRRAERSQIEFDMKSGATNVYIGAHSTKCC